MSSLGKKRKVLLIAYYFPPAGGSAVRRIIAFVTYLSRLGWDVTVLTARKEDYSLTDPSLLAVIPDNVTVCRTRAPDPYTLFARVSGSEKEDVDIATLTSPDDNYTFLQKMAVVIRKVFFIPDARLGWITFLIRAGSRIIKKEKIDIILASSPPFSTALGAGLLSKLTAVPWVSDYRDPWTGAYFYLPRPAFSSKVEEALEQWLLKSAAGIITINKQIRRDLELKYG